jgi:GntR family phosphonate transport system transcriptional regulator
MSAYLINRGEGSAPVYRQIRDTLAEEISGIYNPGDALPSEGQLADRFAVNRHTLRRAIDELVSDGLLERHHGRGVFVLEPAINYSIGSTTRFTENIEAQGHETACRVVRKQLIPARGGVAKKLQIEEGDQVIFLETLREVKNRPFCLISHFLPLVPCCSVLASYDKGSLHGFLKKHCGIELKRSESLISTVLPETEDASRLFMPRHMPVLRVKSVNLDIESKIPVEYAVTRFRGDAVQLSFQPL